MQRKKKKKVIFAECVWFSLQREEQTFAYFQSLSLCNSHFAYIESDSSLVSAERKKQRWDAGNECWKNKKNFINKARLQKKKKKKKRSLK